MKRKVNHAMMLGLSMVSLLFVGATRAEAQSACNNQAHPFAGTSTWALVTKGYPFSPDGPFNGLSYVHFEHDQQAATCSAQSCPQPPPAPLSTGDFFIGNYSHWRNPTTMPGTGWNTRSFATFRGRQMQVPQRPGSCPIIAITMEGVNPGAAPSTSYYYWTFVGMLQPDGSFKGHWQDISSAGGEATLTPFSTP